MEGNEGFDNVIRTDGGVRRPPGPSVRTPWRERPCSGPYGRCGRCTARKGRTDRFSTQRQTVRSLFSRIWGGRNRTRRNRGPGRSVERCRQGIPEPYGSRFHGENGFMQLFRSRLEANASRSLSDSVQQLGEVGASLSIILSESPKRPE